MRQALIAAFFLALLPSFAAAASVPAGFAPGALWLSKTSATAGDTITIFTVVYDSSSNPIEGDVAFSVDDGALGSQHFKLAAGASQIISIDWKATSGSHTFGASLDHVSGISDDSIAAAQTNSVEITVAEPPPSPLDSLKNSVTALASSSPAVQNIAQSVFGTTEDLRKKGADWLSDALYTDQSTASSTASTTAKTQTGKVLGAETYRAPASGSNFFAAAKHGLLIVLLAVFQIQWLFYVVLIAVIYILFKVIQGFFRYRE